MHGGRAQHDLLALTGWRVVLSLTLPGYSEYQKPGEMRGNPCRRSKLGSVQQARICAQPVARRRGTRTAQEVRYAAVAFCGGKAMARRRQGRRARHDKEAGGCASRGGAGGNLVGREIGSTRDSPLPDRFSAQSPTAAPSPRSLVSHLSRPLPVPTSVLSPSWTHSTPPTASTPISHVSPCQPPLSAG